MTGKVELGQRSTPAAVHWSVTGSIYSRTEVCNLGVTNSIQELQPPSLSQNR